MSGFDPFAFVGDVAKGVGDVAKGVGDIANNAAKVAAGAVDGAIKAMAPEGNEGEQKSFEDHHEEPRLIPEPQYRDCEIDAFYVEKRYIAVRQITVGANGEPQEGLSALPSLVASWRRARPRDRPVRQTHGTHSCAQLHSIQER